jgi:hypothetical protein
LIGDESRQKLIDCKNRIISALFAYYESIGYNNYEGRQNSATPWSQRHTFFLLSERFGNLVLTISGIFSAATALLESYQIMRLFKLTVFDKISEELLFDPAD